MIETLKVTVNAYEEREEMFRGEPTIVRIRGTFERVLRPLFRALKFKESRYGSADDETTVIRIGGYGDYGNRYTVPSNMAQAILKASEEMEKELVQAMVYAIRTVSGRIERSIVENLEKTVEKVVSGHPAEDTGAETIIKEILGNIADTGVTWDESRKIAEAASRTVASLLKKGKKRGSKRMSQKNR